MKKILFTLAVAAIAAVSAKAQVVLSGTMEGLQKTDVIESGAYQDKEDETVYNQWMGMIPRKVIEGISSPVAGAPLTYAKYNEGGASFALGTGFAKGEDGKKVKGSRSIAYTFKKPLKEGPVYYSFLVSLKKAPKKPLSLSGIVKGPKGTGATACLAIVTPEDNKDAIQLGVKMGKEVVMSSKTIGKGETALVIVKLDQDNAKASLYVNPKVGKKEPKKADATVEWTGEKAFKPGVRGIFVQNSNWMSGNIGNFRLSQSWNAVFE